MFVSTSVAAGAAPTDESFCFTDFDWAGQHGVAMYPATLDVDRKYLKALGTHIGYQNWPDDIRPGKPIPRESDRAVLHTSLRQAAARVVDTV